MPSLRRLLPKGTFRLQPGIPVMILARGLLAGAFFGAQAFVPLTLSATHHYGAIAAGLPLTVGSLGWTVGSLWQSKQRRLRRESLVGLGLVLVATGVAGLVAVAPARGPPWLVFVLWFVSGSGMGVGIASTSVRVMALSPAAANGFNSAALQIADMLGQAALVGLGGVLVAMLASASTPTSGVIPLDLLLACVAAIGAWRVYRGAEPS